MGVLFTSLIPMYSNANHHHHHHLKKKELLEMVQAQADREFAMKVKYGLGGALVGLVAGVMVTLRLCS